MMATSHYMSQLLPLKLYIRVDCSVPWTKAVRQQYSISEARAWQKSTSSLRLWHRQSSFSSSFPMAPFYGARSLSTTQALYRDHHFDTLKFVQRLNDEGFSEEQSKAMMLILSDVIEESIQNLTRTMVLREGRSLLFVSRDPLLTFLYCRRR